MSTLMAFASLSSSPDASPMTLQADAFFSVKKISGLEPVSIAVAVSQGKRPDGKLVPEEWLFLSCRESAGLPRRFELHHEMLLGTSSNCTTGLRYDLSTSEGLSETVSLRRL